MNPFFTNINRREDHDTWRKETNEMTTPLVIPAFFLEAHLKLRSGEVEPQAEYSLVELRKQIKAQDDWSSYKWRGRILKKRSHAEKNPRNLYRHKLEAKLNTTRCTCRWQCHKVKEWMEAVSWTIPKAEMHSSSNQGEES